MAGYASESDKMTRTGVAIALAFSLLTPAAAETPPSSETGGSNGTGCCVAGVSVAATRVHLRRLREQLADQVA